LKISRSLLKLNTLPYRYDSLSNLYDQLHWFPRTTLILPNMVGLDLPVYNGKYFFTIDIKKSMIGKKLGEFCFTKITGRGTRRKRKIVQQKKVKKMRLQKSMSIRKKKIKIKKNVKKFK
jgi:ribosomal protein S19